MTLTEREVGESGAVTVLFGDRGGVYPHGNTVIVRGGDATLVIDPSLGLIPRRDALPGADFVVHTHCHEDHIAGSHLFPDIPWYFHEADLPGIQSIDNMMALFGMPADIDRLYRPVIPTTHPAPTPWRTWTATSSTSAAE